MDLRALRYFIYIAEARSFSRASTLLRIAQPALSRQVRKLEQELGVELFLRTGRHLELTEAGSILLQRSHALMQQAQQAADDVRSQAREVSGVVTLGLSPAAYEMIGPLIVQGCMRRHPKIRINFVEGFSAFIFDKLVQHELALCLLHNPPPQQGIEVQPLVAEPMFLVGPGAGASIPPVKAGMKLDKLPLILPNKTHGMRLLIDQALGSRSDDLNVTVQVDGFVTTKALVAAGLGYTILPYSAVSRDVESGRLSATRLRSPEIIWTLTLAWSADRRAIRRVDAVRSIIFEEIQNFSGARKWPGSGALIQVGSKPR
jgi:LysR family nitrogen assimilation transcriptional regulator